MNKTAAYAVGGNAILAGISLNYYLAHQTVIVHMRRIGFPFSEYEYPNQSRDRPWQIRYTLLAFALSFLAAVLITYAIEKPVQKWMDRKKSSR